MSYLQNDPAVFADEMIHGFVAAHGDLVRRVEGGVARRTRAAEGQVAVVVGGGSGHYPAFAGLVGPGLAHGAAMGNVFASPSAQQVYSVARSVASGGGVLLTYGNYAGDVLNFDEAQDRLIEDGIPCRTVVVTDDISSAPAGERHRRRGVAGDLVVFKAAAWAAEQGLSLDDVWTVADRANERTRTLGVAFSGCRLPGADEPLFALPPNTMAVGMGIHGEPGIEETGLPTADEVAELLVERLLAERPDGADDAAGRVAVILNGLGSVKSEELFVTYRKVAELLDRAGILPVGPEVGEYVTSFEMAGVSLTLSWLDPQLEEAWTAPAMTPAYRRGSVDVESAASAPEDTALPVAAPAFAATEESRGAAAAVCAALSAVSRVIDEQVDELGRLDAIAGDGDHGIGMQRGAAAAREAAESAAREGAGAGGTLRAAGEAWADRAGGTSGALWGLALRTMGREVGDDVAPDGRRVAGAVAEAVEAVARRGKAVVGDKTMLDALVPAAAELGRRVDGGERLSSAWTAAAASATEAAQATAELLPRMGRARPHMERSLGTPDPGAVSLGLAVTAVGETLRRGQGAAHA